MDYNKDLKIVTISDVHGKWNKLTIPKCDILISAGDYSFRGEKNMVEDYHIWLAEQETQYVISVNGNHELWVEKNFEEAKLIAEKACPGIYFIGESQSFEIEGIKFFGSATTPFFNNWAWNKYRGTEIQKEWNKIPLDTNILITHGPPYGILDEVTYENGNFKEHAGCSDLYNKIMELDELKYHIFGHIHSASGQKYFHNKTFVNASICGETYTVDYKPKELDYTR